MLLRGVEVLGVEAALPTATQTQNRTRRLVSVVQELSLARSTASVHAIVRHAARELVDADGAAVVLRDRELTDQERCYYVDEDAIGPLWKGLKFPINSCVSGWAMLHNTAVAIPDVFADPRVPHDIYRETFVKSLVMAPIRLSDPMGAIGVYWAREYQAAPEEVDLLQALADTTAVAFENIAILDQLEARVRERTLALDAANEQLLELSLTDELSGIRNRRGFYLLAEHELGLIRRQRIEASLAYIDVDGLKEINDTLGHEVGSAAIAEIGEVLRANFRESDVIGRVGGDEFAVLIINPNGNEHRLLQRLEDDIARRNELGLRDYHLSVSIGIVDSWAADDLDALLNAADQAMYREKRVKHDPL